MNHKQKLGYILLGAGIMALGIIIGQVISPNIEAQSDGVFDKITCQELAVVDKHGKTAIKLRVRELRGDSINEIFVYDGAGKEAIELSSGLGFNSVYLFNTKSGEAAISLSTSQTFERNFIHVWDSTGKASFNFNAYPKRNELIVYDKSSGAGIGFYSDANEAKQIRWK